MGQTKLDMDTRSRIIELRAKGKSYAKIAEALGIAKQTAVDECRRSEEKIATLQALELEALYEECRVSREERIRQQAEILNKLREEIKRRDLSDIPSGKLIELYAKQIASIREDLIEPKVKSSEEQESDRERRELLDSLI